MERGETTTRLSEGPVARAKAKKRDGREKEEE